MRELAGKARGLARGRSSPPRRLPGLPTASRGQPSTSGAQGHEERVSRRGHSRPPPADAGRRERAHRFCAGPGGPGQSFGRDFRRRASLQHSSAYGAVGPLRLYLPVQPDTPPDRDRAFVERRGQWARFRDLGDGTVPGQLDAKRSCRSRAARSHTQLQPDYARRCQSQVHDQ